MAHTSTAFAAAQSQTYAAPGNKALHLVTRAFAWVAEQRRVNRTIATLSNLSDSTLADIGIDRSSIPNVARYGRRSISIRD
jgi:uncharacterized protein YjiS (DUF1127 family)